MNKKIENVATVERERERERERESYTLINRKEKNKINDRDICTNASNFDIKIENDEDIKTGRRPLRPENET